MPTAIRFGLAAALLGTALLTATIPSVAPHAQEVGAGEEGPRGSGLPVPRFVSLRSGEVNLRTGPGVRYPVEWVFVRRDIPVEITAEFDTWRRIRDWEGAEGWVHQSMLSGRRAIVVTGALRALHKEPDALTPVIARAEPGVIGWLQRCRDDWCEVDIEGYRGWLKRTDFWGAYPGEAVEQ